MALPNPSTLIEYGELRFLIFEAPNETNLPAYLQEFQKHNVKNVVRVCEPTYSTGPLEQAGIKVHDWVFTDGDAPPKTVIRDWRTLVKGLKGKGETLGVHCVAGLGRAPVLVAISLIDAGMENLKAVEFIRSKRRGAINQKQLKFLVGFKPDTDNCIIA
eukprot:TRINITY_DN846_c0_g1_i2.p1 TRINITY_DN846_c0_g1~~TRINITY_DN846_c0_g1_i2.p1  ORF type:complete len:159 (-),score=42.43 TRINITY_DN846_c0_g1_i2:369-845(-)